MSIKAGRDTIGVQLLSSDPRIEALDGHYLSELAQEISAVIERARARWGKEPRHLMHERPVPLARRQARPGLGAVPLLAFSIGRSIWSRAGRRSRSSASR